MKTRSVLLDRMCKSIEHRGPDEQGMFVEGRAALGMRRLSIIDLKTGQQPIYSEDGALSIVFNGEIYNFRELKRELEEVGHRFKTNSDTETIIRAYEEFGESCLEKLRGMFAFAIWNSRDESLFIARDRVGKKPLFYSATRAGNFVFGSELKTLLVHGEIERETDPAALDAYISFGYVPEGFCIFKGVKKLPPGHFLKYVNGQVHVEQYWDFEYQCPKTIKTEGDYVEKLRTKLVEAVQLRLISDVPLGAFLSGGIDSSTVVALMSRLTAQPVKTFSIGFEDESFDELKFARLASKHFRTDHHEFIVTPDFVETIDELVWHFDEPFADPSSLPTYMVSKMAREFVTVVLTGDGGDELFAGYTRYLIDMRRSKWAMLPNRFRRAVLGRVAEGLPHGAYGKGFLFNISLDAADRYIDSISLFNSQRKKCLYGRDFYSRLGDGHAGESEFKRIGNNVSSGNPINRLLYLDSKTYLPGDILTKVDRMTMANSLEARAPLLDHELIEYVSEIPSDLKLKGSDPKYILKKAMEGIVPNEILYREKQGFGVPIREWINKQVRSRIRETLLDSTSIQRGYFDRSYIERLLNEHSTRRRDHSYPLWGLFMLELWHRQFIDSLQGSWGKADRFQINGDLGT